MTSQNPLNRPTEEATGAGPDPAAENPADLTPETELRRTPERNLMKTDCIPTTIMIVDDEPGNLNVLGAMLSGAGLGVRALPGGALALAAARAELPDLVLLDIQMPGMDGYEVCRRFKADEQLRGVPIIFLSAFTQPSDKLRAFEAGGVDYVTKPFAEVEVLARIGTHLQLRRHQLHLEELVAQRMRELTEANRRLQLWDDAKNQWLLSLIHISEPTRPY